MQNIRKHKEIGKSKSKRGSNNQRVAKTGGNQWKEVASGRHKSVNIVLRKKCENRRKQVEKDKSYKNSRKQIETNGKEVESGKNIKKWCGI